MTVSKASSNEVGTSSATTTSMANDGEGGETGDRKK